MKFWLVPTVLAILLCTKSAGTETIPPWATPDSSAWANETKAIWITDMSRCNPSSALSITMKRGHWKTYPYELTTGQKGIMVWTSATAKAPALRIPLGVKGWYAIFVGLFSGANGSVAWIKLNTDVAPLKRSNSNADYYGNFRDTLFKVAQLNGDETLQFAPQTEGYASACGVGYVKLIPLSDQEIKGIQADRADTSKRNMTVTDDGFSFIYAQRPTTTEDLLTQIEPLRYSDVDTLIMEQFGGDKVMYPSAVGTMPGLDMDDFAELGHRYYVETVRAFARQKINPLKVLIDGAHGVGVKIHVGIRPAGTSWAPPYDEFWETPFFKNHPEWYCIDRDGKVTTRMSWAVPEVRRHYIELLQEMLRLGADGVNIVFVRGVPVVLYEPAFCKMFQDKYGIDARTLEDTDSRILSMRSDVVTTFFRELRAMLDAEQKRRGDGKRLQASVVTFGNEYDNSWYGIDIRRLVNEGLLDHIMVYPFDIGARKGGVDYAFFREVCTPKGVPFRVAGAFDTHKLLKYAVEAYDGGAPRIGIFGGVGRDIDDWLPLSRMGHESEVRELAKSGPARSRYYFFRMLGNKVMDGRFLPIGGG
ncbi:MAG TPA: hypothetical protein VNJ09_08935 [Chthonomonadales bacterium]|nr:hypothetical protein [Chthonomonadales bacterium]